MKCIYKFSIQLEDKGIGNPEGLAKCEFFVPRSFQATEVRTQRGHAMVWGVADLPDPMVGKLLRLWVAVTGQPFDLPAGAQYLGTCHDVAGILTMHIFQEEV